MRLMIAKLEPGTFSERTWQVTPEMCPHFDGVLVHPVYATWTMVHHMEVVGRKLIVPYLETHEEAVGAHVSVDHKSPALIGSNVTVRAEVETATAHRLTCTVSARCGPRLIGQGVLVQVVMQKTRLDAMLARHAND